MSPRKHIQGDTGEYLTSKKRSPWWVCSLLFSAVLCILEFVLKYVRRRLWRWKEPLKTHDAELFRFFLLPQPQRVPKIFAVFRPPKICTNTAISDSEIENESLMQALLSLNFLFCLVLRAHLPLFPSLSLVIRSAGAAGFVSLTSCLYAVRPGNHCHKVKEIWSACKFSSCA